MPLRLRQLIFAVLTLFFVISAPLIILYTAGYKYNINKNIVEKTGSLVLDSVPPKARILLNERDAHKLTPATFSHLLPDDYRIRLEKEGYYPWEKTLPVTSKRTTFATDVVFFREASPEMSFNKKIKFVVPAPDGASAAFVSIEKTQAEELSVWNLENEHSARFSAPGKIDGLTWSPSSKYILVKLTGSQKFFAVPRESGQTIDIFKIFGREWKNLVWSENNDDELYGSAPEGGAYGIYKINLDNKTAKKISSGGSRVWQQNSRLYTLVPSNNGIKLLQISETERPVEITALKAGDYTFLASRTDILMLADKTKSLLYLLKPEFNDPILLETRATYAVWSPSFKKLMISDDFELRLYDYEKNEINFVTRHGEPVKKALWLDSENHLVIEFRNSILGAELDYRDNNYSPTLASGKDISDLFLADKTKTAYFTAETAEGRRLFKLSIQ